MKNFKVGDFVTIDKIKNALIFEIIGIDYILSVEEIKDSIYKKPDWDYVAKIVARIDGTNVKIINDALEYKFDECSPTKISDSLKSKLLKKLTFQ